RSVGGALHSNPLGLVIPCHRVLGINGALVGFGGGLEMKQKLLELEGIYPKMQTG
ncbi:MAG TPA: MGMT family protein, partial [Candidatus Marinimicrobia bacterium]|nr:MGMT family protein [Candidatus Neomarinimicrobiota bacterium]